MRRTVEWTHSWCRVLGAMAALVSGGCSGSASSGPAFGATPTQLAIITSAAGATSGAAFATQPTIALRDATNATVTSNNVSTVLLTVSSGAVLLGTGSAITVKGLASFSGVGLIGSQGPTYTLTFSSGSLTPATQSITLPITLTFSTIEAAHFFSCGVASSGSTYCWGAINNHGQLGDGTQTARSWPSPISGSLTFVQLSSSAGTGCGLTTSGAAYCWGDGTFGNLGNGGFFTSTAPVAVQAGVNFISLSHGKCGLTATGAAYCWGWNPYGQDGDGTTTNHELPVAVTQGSVRFSSIAGGDFHTCGRTSAGATYCWGHNSFGQLGDGTAADRGTPTAVLGGLAFVSLAVGDNHTCGLTNAGAAYCWGYNIAGQLGDGTSTNRNAPVAVSGALSFESLAAGSDYTCGLTLTHSAYCWGNNRLGQLGNGTAGGVPDFRTTPTAVAGGSTFTSISAGVSHACGLTPTGAPLCWGSINNVDPTPVPTPLKP